MLPPPETNAVRRGNLLAAARIAGFLRSVELRDQESRNWFDRLNAIQGRVLGKELQFQKADAAGNDWQANQIRIEQRKILEEGVAAVRLAFALDETTVYRRDWELLVQFAGAVGDIDRKTAKEVLQASARIQAAGQTLSGTDFVDAVKNELERRVGAVVDATIEAAGEVVEDIQELNEAAREGIQSIARNPLTSAGLVAVIAVAAAVIFLVK